MSYSSALYWQDIEKKLDELDEKIEIIEKFLNYKNVNSTKCFFDSLSPEDRYKPMELSCPCRKCTPYSLGV